MPSLVINISNSTFVSSAQPDNNFLFYPLLYTGTDLGFQTCISLLQIELPELPVTAVDSAILQLAVIVKSGIAPSPIAVNKVTASFDAATVTYNTKPAYTATPSQINVTAADLYTKVQIDITSLVNEWLSGASVNNGIALTNSDGTTVVDFANENIGYQPFFPTLTITYSESPVQQNSALNFSYAQLAHVIEQLIELYPENVMTVYTKGFTAASVTGTPYKLFKSLTGTYGSIFILMDAGKQEAIPLNAITAIYAGDGTVYNPSITYLTPPKSFIPGYDANLITAYNEYFPVLTEMNIYLGSVVNATGTVYKNEYGIIVLSDSAGNTPIFIPVLSTNLVLPTFVSPALHNGEKVKLSISAKP